MVFWQNSSNLTSIVKLQVLISVTNQESDFSPKSHSTYNFLFISHLQMPGCDSKQDVIVLASLWYVFSPWVKNSCSFDLKQLLFCSTYYKGDYCLSPGNALGIWICGCRCILESSGSQNSGCIQYYKPQNQRVQKVMSQRSAGS